MIFSKASSSVDTFTAARAAGFRTREWFSHRAVALHKQYPDTFLVLAGRGVTESEVLSGRFCQINIYSDHLRGLPADLFTDRSVNWHGQQLGETGLIAAAGLYLQADSVTVTLMQSDLCQQLFRHRALKRRCKTRVENRFGYWYRILLNAILDFAIDAGVAVVNVPTAASILAATRKPVAPDLFTRIYDTPARHYCCHRIEKGPAEYWALPLTDNSERIVRLLPAPRPKPADRRSPLICVFHDTEEDVDTTVSSADCRSSLTTMLQIEKEHGMSASYNVLGRLLNDKRDEIWSSNPTHSIAFHSFDHDVSSDSQLTRCRAVSLQIRGYRPPRSIITPELTDYRLSYLNFEWLASSAHSLGSTSCRLQNGVVKIPIATDDHPIHTRRTTYPDWERGLLDLAQKRPFLAFGLHDCYAPVWLDFYGRLLERLASIGELVTADALCDRIFWEQGLDLGPTEQ